MHIIAVTERNICRSLSANSVYVSVARALSFSQTLSLITMQTQIRRIHIGRMKGMYVLGIASRFESVMILSGQKCAFLHCDRSLGVLNNIRIRVTRILRGRKTNIGKSGREAV